MQAMQEAIRVLLHEADQPYTAAGNQNFVRLMLHRKQPVFARALERAVSQLSPSVVPAREYEPGYDAERELQDWMNELRTARQNGQVPS